MDFCRVEHASYAIYQNQTKLTISSRQKLAGTCFAGRKFILLQRAAVIF